MEWPINVICKLVIAKVLNVSITLMIFSHVHCFDMILMLLSPVYSVANARSSRKLFYISRVNKPDRYFCSTVYCVRYISLHTDNSSVIYYLSQLR